MIKFFFFLLFPLSVFASNSVVYNITDNKVLSGSLDSTQVSIASISKLMTIYTVLIENQDLTENLTVEDGRVSNTHIRKGMVVSRLDLINLALISSDNLAAQTLSENFPGGKNSFIKYMNIHAQELSMVNTKFIEPTGLSPMNYSSVFDIVKLIQAVSTFDIVQHAAQSQKVVTSTIIKSKKGKKNVSVSGNPTSHYFGHQGLVAIKTGFTKAAGFCITMLVYHNNQLYNITMLGAKTNKERELFIKQSLSTIYSA
jgi:D-alanyl-D-alanine endopeptidase (penicillin-binding protein 7)